MRIIKKYPNRRLYDTATSSYITMAEVRTLVLERAEFRIVDARSNTDLTRCTLLQIILEEENGGAPLFSSTALAQIIRCYDQALQNEMCSYIEHNLQTLLDRHCPPRAATAAENWQTQPTSTSTAGADRKR